jgi:FAD/FMN-containing dehydrogenase
VSAATAEAREALQKQRPAVNLLVHDAVHAVGGSISAEHGLGQLKRDEIRRYKSPIDLAVMASIKRALDPNNLMNPGKVL